MHATQVLGPAAYRRELFPHLIRAIESGSVRWDGREYYGIASDGKEVTIADDPTIADRYLADRPNPSQW